jgi:transcriptional regulator with XRE-family HTH domain
MLREARAHAGLTQRALAGRAGIPQPAISRIESGHGSPRVDTLDRLLRACGKTVDLADRPGIGVDLTLIAERIRLTPGERARRAALEWNRTRAIRG